MLKDLDSQVVIGHVSRNPLGWTGHADGAVVGSSGPVGGDAYLRTSSKGPPDLILLTADLGRETMRISSGLNQKFCDFKSFLGEQCPLLERLNWRIQGRRASGSGASCITGVALMSLCGE